MSKTIYPLEGYNFFLQFALKKKPFHSLLNYSTDLKQHFLYFLFLNMFKNTSFSCIYSDCHTSLLSVFFFVFRRFCHIILFCHLILPFLMDSASINCFGNSVCIFICRLQLVYWKINLV